MTDDRSLERAARSWIETGSTTAPDHAVEAALARIQTTPQERDLQIPWRFRKMTMQARLGAAAVIGVLAIGGGLLLFNRGPQVGNPSQPPGPTMTTSPSTIPGWIVFEHFGRAPDGSSTVFDNNLRQIWLVHADGTDLHELAPGNPVGKASPDIAPDGTKVIFSSWENPSRLWETPIEGGQSVQVSGDCPAETACIDSDPAYSPDGKRVAFMRVEGHGSTESSVIAVLDLATAQVTLVETTRVPLASGDLAQPTWSPDGLQLAYHRNTRTPTDEFPTQTRIEVVNVDGTRLHELPPPDGEAKAGDPDWSPDGSLIVFSTMPNREGEGDALGHLGIYTIRPDGTGVTELCDWCLGGGMAPSYTPDGKHILFWGSRTWALMDLDGGNLAHINESKLTWFGNKLGYGYFALLQPTP